MPEPAAQRRHAGPPPPVRSTLAVAMRRTTSIRRSRAVPPSDVRASTARRAAGRRRRHVRSCCGSRLQRATRSATAVAKRRLAPVYRGVYAVGPPLSDRGPGPRGDCWRRAPHAAGELLHGDGAHRLIPTLPAVLHVSLTRGDRRSRPGLHRPPTDSNPTTSRTSRGIPVTTPLRTLEDLGWPDRLVREALARGLVPAGASLPCERPDGQRLRGPHARARHAGPACRSRSRSTGVGRYRARLRVAGAAASPSRPTAGRTHGRRAGASRTTAPATRSCSPRAGACCASRTAGCAREPTLVAAQLAAVLAQAAAPSASNSSVYSWPVASATGS